MSCRLLSRNSVQTNKELSLEPVGFFRHICFLGAGKYLTFYQYRQWNSAKLCVLLVGCHPSDSDLAIQFADWCKWLVYVASLLAHKPHLLLFFVLIGYDIVKTLPRCYLRTCMEEPGFFLQRKNHRQQQHPIPFDAVAMKATASFIREKITQDQIENCFCMFRSKSST